MSKNPEWLDISVSFDDGSRLQSTQRISSADIVKNRLPTAAIRSMLISMVEQIVEKLEEDNNV